MNLSPNFTLEELTKSQVALRHEIDNTPGDAEIANLGLVAENILQPVRDHFGVPFAPSSGFRCLELNRLLNSRDTSQHITGQAVDIEVPGVSNFDLAVWVRDNLQYDQVILECYTAGDPSSGWVHCSYVGEANRTVALTFSDRRFSEGLIA
jgi:hypothetical protein